MKSTTVIRAPLPKLDKTCGMDNSAIFSGKGDGVGIGEEVGVNVPVGRVVGIILSVGVDIGV